MKKYNIGLAVLFILIGLAMFVNAGTLPAAESGIGSGFWPQLLSVVLIVLSALLIIQSLSLKKRPATEQDEAFDPEEPPIDFKSPGMRRVLIACGILAVFCGIMYLVGFLIASAFLIPAIMLLMGQRRPVILAGVTAGVLVAVYVIFVLILKLPLPSGLFL